MSLPSRNRNIAIHPASLLVANLEPEEFNLQFEKMML